MFAVLTVTLSACATRERPLTDGDYYSCGILPPPIVTGLDGQAQAPNDALIVGGDPVAFDCLEERRRNTERFGGGV